jgi:hypothetical protein
MHSWAFDAVLEALVPVWNGFWRSTLVTRLDRARKNKSLLDRFLGGEGFLLEFDGHGPHAS